jgi:hypothetical protein
MTAEPRCRSRAVFHGGGKCEALPVIDHSRPIALLRLSASLRGDCDLVKLPWDGLTKVNVSKNRITR